MVEAENGVYPTSITGEQISGEVGGTVYTVNEFGTSAGKVKCKSAKFSATISGVSETINVTPTYSECTFAGVAATVEMNGCTEVLTTGATVGGSPDKIQSKWSLNCPAGAEKKYTSANCVISFPGSPKNQNIASETIENETVATPFMAIKIYENVNGYHYTTNGKCPNDGGISHTNTDATTKGVRTFKSTARGVTVT